MELGNDLEGVSWVTRTAEAALEAGWVDMRDNVEVVAGTLEEHKVQLLLMKYTEVMGSELVRNYLLVDIREDLRVPAYG